MDRKTVRRLAKLERLKVFEHLLPEDRVSTVPVGVNKQSDTGRHARDEYAHTIKSNYT